MSTTSTPTYNVQHHAVVGHDEWIDARKALLAKEKEFTHQRDRLSQARRDLPWERVEKTYEFDGPGGKQTLAQLFGGRSQLVVYHFMFEPEWDEGCKSCSFWADNFNLIPPHLRARDISFVAISRAPREKLDAYKKRMGWSFPWFSSFASDFNSDFGVTFTQAEADAEQGYYNYRLDWIPGRDVVGVGVFYKDESGKIYHTYSAYSRGVDILNGAYNYIDLTPKGRDEGETSQAWVRRHDEYPS